MKTNKQTPTVPRRYKSVEAFIEAKLSESVENVKKINFNILKKKAASKGDF